MLYKCFVLTGYLSWSVEKHHSIFSLMYHNVSRIYRDQALIIFGLTSVYRILPVCPSGLLDGCALGRLSGCGQIDWHKARPYWHSGIHRVRTTGEKQRARPWWTNYISEKLLLSSFHPRSGGDLLFMLSPPVAAAAFCFCSHLKTTARSMSKYLQYAYWPWGICLVIFFCVFSIFQKKSKMAAKILCRSLELELLHGFASCLVQRTNPTLCWLVFGVIMIIKTYILFFYVLGF